MNEIPPLQPVKRTSNFGTVVAEKLCDLLGAGETCSVTVHESQYIPLTEQEYSHAFQATLDRRFRWVSVRDDKPSPGLQSISQTSRNRRHRGYLSKKERIEATLPPRLHPTGLLPRAEADNMDLYALTVSVDSLRPLCLRGLRGGVSKASVIRF